MRSAVPPVPSLSKPLRRGGRFSKTLYTERRCGMTPPMAVTKSTCTWTNQQPTGSREDVDDEDHRQPCDINPLLGGNRSHKSRTVDQDL